VNDPVNRSKGGDEMTPYELGAAWHGLVTRPARWRRWLDFQEGSDKWLRVEELREDGTLVVRAEIPGIDPDKDIEVQVTDELLHIAGRR
jgi:HSP20 family molecular chaperone IbpA